MTYKIGEVLEGEITGIQPYGAFVSLDNEEQGLIHISEVKHGYIKNIHDVLSIGDKVNVCIIDIDEYSTKISLSIRALDPHAPTPQYKRKKYFTNKKKKIGFDTLEKAMPQWIATTIEELNRK